MQIHIRQTKNGLAGSILNRQSKIKVSTLQFTIQKILNFVTVETKKKHYAEALNLTLWWCDLNTSLYIYIANISQSARVIIISTTPWANDAICVLVHGKY